MTVDAGGSRTLAHVQELAPGNEIFRIGRRWLRASAKSGHGVKSKAARESSSHQDASLLQATVADAGIVAVVGLRFEARIVAGPTVRAVFLGSELSTLAVTLLPTDLGVISFGICGGLAPGLRAGACVVASCVYDGARVWPTDKAWTKSLARSIPNAIIAPILGVDAPVLEVADKRRLHKNHGAVAVDTESHLAAVAASAHGVPFVAVRAVADEAHCKLVSVALAGRLADGSVSAAGVWSALKQQPGELAPLIRLAAQTGLACATLMRLRPHLAAHGAPREG